jgi:hypothetical protein
LQGAVYVCRIYVHDKLFRNLLLQRFENLLHTIFYERLVFIGWGLFCNRRTNNEDCAGGDCNILQINPILTRRVTGAIVASASLVTFGCTGRMTDPVRIRSAQAPVPVGNLIRLASEAESRNVSGL